MKSILEIKSELNEIKYYYSMREVFEQGAINGVPSNLENKVNVYNNAISQAPAQLYAFYISYYVNNQKRQRGRDNNGNVHRSACQSRV